MVFGFIGQELSETTSSPAAPSTTLPPSRVAESQTGPTVTYIPVNRVVSEVDAVHNTLLVGLLVALVAASVALGGLTIYCLRRRQQKKMQKDYQAELHEIQRKEDEGKAAARAV